MTEKYDKYVKPIMDELNKKFKYLTKVDGNCWLIQSKENSLMEAYYVHTTENCHIIMSGDYDGIMVRPYGNANALPNWMSGATTLGYFAEKVCAANRFHKCKMYSPEIARENIKEIKECFLERFDKDEESGEETKEEKKFDDLIRYESLECEDEYWNLLRKLGHELELYDLDEYDPTEYTSQIKWQHKCLVFWANKVLDGDFKNKIQEKKND